MLPTGIDAEGFVSASKIELAKGSVLPEGGTTVGVNGAKKNGGVGALQ